MSVCNSKSPEERYLIIRVNDGNAGWVTIDVMVRICGHDLTHTSGANEIEREILD